MAPFTPLSASGQEPGRAGEGGLAGAGDAPGMALQATETNADNLAGILSQLREENARLRETVSALAFALARLAGGSGPSADTGANND